MTTPLSGGPESRSFLAEINKRKSPVNAHSAMTERLAALKVSSGSMHRLKASGMPYASAMKSDLKLLEMRDCSIQDSP